MRLWLQAVDELLVPGDWRLAMMVGGSMIFIPSAGEGPGKRITQPGCE
jgi:hypothetical protein